MSTLYEIVGDIHDLLSEEFDDVSGDLETKLAALEIAFPAKIEAILKFRQELLADVEALSVERERLKAREDAIARKAEWLKSYVMRGMQTIGQRKVQTLTFTASLAKSPPKVEMEAGTAIPAEYTREKITYELDKQAILADFKAGKSLPINISVTQNEHLKIS